MVQLSEKERISNLGSITNKIMLITYPDSMGGNLSTLKIALQQHFKGAIGGIHILPFFPSSGDRGFSPITYREVDSGFGTWQEVEELAHDHYLMCDMMVNHVSRRCVEFQDYLEKKDASPYANMFLRYDTFWGEGRPTPEDLQLLYRRKDGEPYQQVTFSDGETRKLWCSFTDEQLDIDTAQTVTVKYLKENLRWLSSKGISIVRLDAYGYITKRKGTNCFFVEPEIWDLITDLRDTLERKGMLVLPEVHDVWQTSLKFAERGIWSYDFVLPLLMLHTLYTQNAEKLAHWLQICPRNQFTVLDTHDGVGVFDAFDWVDNQQAQAVIEKIEDRLSYAYKPLNPEKKRFFRSYQLYGTYYSLLHENSSAYLLARAIQFFAPGIPQVYYVGMLAGENDIEALMANPDHRAINRHNYSLSEIDQCCKTPLVGKLIALMRFRNEYPAFGGEIKVNCPESNILEVSRTQGAYEAIMKCDLKTYQFTIYYRKDGKPDLQPLILEEN
ncbi:MAG TPA: sucrose phosphorylase [Firmicutes bacterium]|nr:sucrose phosphorylase [Bacillota bacterium]